MTGVDPGVNRRVHQDIHERLLRAVVAEQDHAQPAQGKVLRHVIARLARHDDIRTGGDGKLAKVAEGAAQNGDGAARALGIAPYAWVAAKGRGSTWTTPRPAAWEFLRHSKTRARCAILPPVLRARVVECRKCAQAGRLGVVHVLQRAIGYGVQQLA